MEYILDPYDEGLREILKNGVQKKNRTGIDTLSVFGMQRRYRIDERFPLLTKRKVWPKAIFAELLWMLSGSTNNKDLQALGSNIWTPWVDDKFQEMHGYEEGSLGPVYGFQLRHFNGTYGVGQIADQHDGVDQLAYIVRELKNNPESRRIMFSLWNPCQISQMRLPPCHFCFILSVTEGKLSGMLVQRSADYPVGVPANIQFYSALIYMLAQQAKLTPYEFVHTTADSHIYVNQIEAVEEYLARPTTPSPRMVLAEREDILDYKMSDFEIIGYKPADKITIPVAV